jgi:hypothetical protein
VSFVTITLCIASQRVFIVVSVYFVIDFSPETFGYTIVLDRICQVLRRIVVRRCYYILYNLGLEMIEFPICFHMHKHLNVETIVRNAIMCMVSTFFRENRSIIFTYVRG